MPNVGGTGYYRTPSLIARTVMLNASISELSLAQYERDVARLAYFGLFALQHRGQESAGIAVGNGKILEDGKVRPLDIKAGDTILVELATLRGHAWIDLARLDALGRETPVLVDLKPVGEGYMEGDIVFEQGTISDLLAIVGESGSGEQCGECGPIRPCT